jgi:ferredoxin
MIVAERKPIAEIQQMLEPHERVLIVGCGTCVTVCMSGGEKEAELLSTVLELAFKDKGKLFSWDCVERQCEPEFLEALTDKVEASDAVLSMACGAGVQTMVAQFASVPVYPALNTLFVGRPLEQGLWTETCAGCGNCILHKTGGICPIARCSKSLLNGPCGGSVNGRCEVDPEHIECAWQLIYDRLEKAGTLYLLDEILPPKDWSSSAHGGVRRLVREDVRL